MRPQGAAPLGRRLRLLLYRVRKDGRDLDPRLCRSRKREPGAKGDLSVDQKRAFSANGRLSRDQTPPPLPVDRDSTRERRAQLELVANLVAEIIVNCNRKRFWSAQSPSTEMGRDSGRHNRRQPELSGQIEARERYLAECARQE